MRILLGGLLLLLAGAVGAAALDGTWRLDTPDGAITAQLVTQGRTVAGSVDFAGRSTITLRGTLRGDTAATGQAASAAGSGEFEARLAGDALELVLSQGDGPNQRAARLPLSLRRVVAAPPAPATGRGGAGPRDAGGDPRLVGGWEWQEVINSGSASFAQSEWLVIRADGTFATGQGRAAGGAAGWSFNGAAAGAATQGHWRAAAGVLFVLGADGAWVRAGTYGMTDDGSAMRITADGGARRLWRRR